MAADNSLLQKLVPGDSGDGTTFESLAQMESGSFVYSSSKAYKPYRCVVGLYVDVQMKTCQRLVAAGSLEFMYPRSAPGRTWNLSRSGCKAATGVGDYDTCVPLQSTGEA